MSEILKVYIVGAYRAATSLQRQGNILKAAALGLEVVKLGAVAVVPHTMTQYWEGAVADEVILSMLIELMKSCDAVILVDNWVLSPGSRDEIHEAEQCGMPVFETLGQLRDYMADRVSVAIPQADGYSVAEHLTAKQEMDAGIIRDSVNRWAIRND